MKKEIEFPKGATIEVKENKIVIEYDDVFKPKNGDFCAIDEDYENHRVLFIYRCKAGRYGNSYYHAAKIGTLTRINPTVGLSGLPRPATEEEREELLSELHKIGKDWDAEKMELVDLKWRPKLGYFVYISDIYGEEKYRKVVYDGGLLNQRMLKYGIMFRTDSEAIACTERMLDAVKTK